MVSPGVPNMAMVNVNNFLNVKDSRWLQLEVCREFQRNKCTRPDTECKFAHPPPNVEVQNGRVTACYDSIKGRCNREKPPCKYFHPPQHLKDQLLINGRNHLALKNAIMTQIQGLSPGTPVVPGTIPVHNSPYLAGIPTMGNFNPYIASSPVMTMGMTDVASPITGVVPQQVVTAQKVPRTDRLEAFPGMGVPYKRPAGDKSGVPVYQPTGNAAYQQALMQQLGGQSFVPVSCEYGGSVTLAGVGGQADTQDTTAANNHAAASSAQPTPSSSSSSTSTTTTINSQTTGKAIFSSPPSGTTTTSTTSSTSSSSSVAGETAGASPAPLPPQQPVNVFSYTGYALSKGLRPQFKPPTSAPTIMGPTALATHGMVPPGLTAGHLPGLSYGGVAAAPLASMGVTPYVSTAQQLVVPGMTHSVAGMGLPAMSHGLGGMAAGMAPALGGVATASLGGLGGGMPLMSPSLMVPQYPASSILPQYTALSSNTNYSLAQGGEQPYKKLKTS
ncbi:uncharacterized protein [Penaeus vannamei]|uniref:uncharacterized protein isoform X20 n=1 Tax=Penaeus vannamei TaxID=6689 RepID=UPI00387F84F0